MKVLEKTIRKNGYDYRQVKRTKRVAMYEQLNESGTCIQYEVFKIKILPTRDALGKVFPEKEKFPANEDFGYSAWSIHLFEMANEKYKTLVHKYEGGDDNSGKYNIVKIDDIMHKVSRA